MRSWRKFGVRGAGCAGVLAVGLMMSACGTPAAAGESLQSAASPTRVATTPATDLAAQTQALPDASDAVTSSAPTYAAVKVPSAVADRFGRAEAEGAYRQVAELTTALSFQPDLIGRRDGFTAADFAQGRDRLTAGMRAQWDAKVKRALGGDAEAKGVVQALVFYDIEPDLTFPADESLGIRQSVSTPSVAVDGRGDSARLRVSFTLHGELRATMEGTAMVEVIDKTITYFLREPAAGTSVWLIDGWNAQYTGKSQPSGS